MKPAQSVTSKPSFEEDCPLNLPHWEQLLDGERLNEDLRSRWRNSLKDFVGFCGRAGEPASIGLMKKYLGEARKRGKFVAEARLALLWFLGEARKERLVAGSSSQGGGRVSNRDGIPSIGASDLGDTDWEERLIRAIRRRGLMWRTEETYRSWAQRFVAFTAPKPVHLADKEDVALFLEDLAVKLRVAASTQKQALNAVVFLMQEG